MTTTRRFTQLQAMALLLPGLVMSGVVAPDRLDAVGYAAVAALLALALVGMRTYRGARTLHTLSQLSAESPVPSTRGIQGASHAARTSC